MGVYVYVVTRKVVAKYKGEPVYGEKFAYKPFGWGARDADKINNRWYNQFAAPRQRAWDKAGGVNGTLITHVDDDEKVNPNEMVLIQRVKGNAASYYDEPTTPTENVAICRADLNCGPKVLTPTMEFGKTYKIPCTAELEYKFTEKGLEITAKNFIDNGNLGAAIRLMFERARYLKVYGRPAVFLTYNTDEEALNGRHKVNFDYNRETEYEFGKDYPVIDIEPTEEKAA